MALNEDIEKLKFDKRMNEWNLNQKQITMKEIHQHLESLPDLSNLAQPIINKEEITSDSSSDSSSASDSSSS